MGEKIVSRRMLARERAVFSTTLVGSGLFPCRRGCRRNFPDVRRQSDADRLEDATDVTGHRGAQEELLSLLFGLDLLQPVELANELTPFRFQARGGEMLFQDLALGEGQERAEHVAANGLVRLVIDRPRVEDRFGRPEDVFDLEQLAIAQHDGKRVELHVGAQDIETIIARVLGDALLVDLEMLLIGRLEIASIGAIANERLVATAQTLAQAAQYGLAHFCVARGCGTRRSGACPPIRSWPPARHRGAHAGSAAAQTVWNR